jgi:hypothetical protein
VLRSAVSSWRTTKHLVGASPRRCQGDLRAISRAMRFSRKKMNNTRQNLVFAFGYNALGVPLAADEALTWSRCALATHRIVPWTTSRREVR